MKKFLLILPLMAIGLSACETSNQNAAAGALGGAALGAAVSDNKLQGALIGAAVGVAASTLIGPAPTAGKCYYRNSRGERYIDNC